mmetsp:Transcript_38418/g.63639  ORF Transcript_38418/g.63639 Transcript_38418/m.63639 type:complete len:272 (-) Transcript_38418:139-954(-)
MLGCPGAMFSACGCPRLILGNCGFGPVVLMELVGRLIVSDSPLNSAPSHLSISVASSTSRSSTKQKPVPLCTHASTGWPAHLLSSACSIAPLRKATSSSDVASSGTLPTYMRRACRVSMSACGARGGIGLDLPPPVATAAPIGCTCPVLPISHIDLRFRGLSLSRSLSFSLSPSYICISCCTWCCTSALSSGAASRSESPSRSASGSRLFRPFFSSPADSLAFESEEPPRRFRSRSLSRLLSRPRRSLRRSRPLSLLLSCLRLRCLRRLSL